MRQHNLFLTIDIYYSSPRYPNSGTTMQHTSYHPYIHKNTISQTYSSSLPCLWREAMARVLQLAQLLLLLWGPSEGLVLCWSGPPQQFTCMSLLVALCSSTSIWVITIIIIAFKGAIRDPLQSPHSAANCLLHVRSSGPGAIVCKLRATHQALITCKCHVTCHLVRRDSSAIKFDRVEIAFIWALFYWLNH